MDDALLLEVVNSALWKMYLVSVWSLPFFQVLVFSGGQRYFSIICADIYWSLSAVKYDDTDKLFQIYTQYICIQVTKSP